MSGLGSQTLLDHVVDFDLQRGGDDIQIHAQTRHREDFVDLGISDAHISQFFLVGFRNIVGRHCRFHSET
ncbi:MAG: hypothetical protein O7A62_00475, partial [Alphaproteobacteria bacterium]|nr:hypothetical protein [Alphaproteobacteria bacterium]